MAVSVEVHGVNELKMKLTDLANMTKIKQAVDKATVVVEGEIKSLTPVVTGKLRSSIHPKPAVIEGNSAVGKVYTNTEYAMYVEYGVGRLGQGSHPKLASGYSNEVNGFTARAMFYRGLKNKKKAVTTLIRSAVQEDLRR